MISFGTAAMTFRLGPFGPGVFRFAVENSWRYFLVVNARWKRRSVEGFRLLGCEPVPQVACDCVRYGNRTSDLPSTESSHRSPPVFTVLRPRPLVAAPVIRHL